MKYADAGVIWQNCSGHTAGRVVNHQTAASGSVFSGLDVFQRYHLTLGAVPES